MGGLNRKRNIFLLVFLVFFVFLGFFVYKPNVFAATSYSIENIGGTIGLGTVDLKTLVINIIKWVLGILSLVAVSYLIYGGILWLTSRGNEEKIAKAKKTIVNAVIGVIIVLLAWAIVLFVTRFITNAGNGGISCTTGDPHPNDPCLVCRADGKGYRFKIEDETCLDPVGPKVFRVMDFSTAHEPGPVNENLYICSGIGTLFNRDVDGTTVTPIANTDLKLEELKCSVSGTKCFIPTDCGGGPDVCQATLVSGDWSTMASTLKYQHKKVCSNDPTKSCLTASECGDPNTCDFVLFAQDMNYRLSLPKTIKSADGFFLSQTNLLFCDASADPITCTFSTGFLNDTTPPEVTTTDPTRVDPPDQNVNRTPIIRVNFSESIDVATLMDSASHPLLNNIFLQKLDVKDGAPQAGGALDANSDTFIDPDKLILAEGTDRFSLRLEDPNLLEPFTWYRITVRNVADMCGNVMAAAVFWEFETNAKVPGIQGWSPKGDNQCPDVKITAVFNTSMYYHRVQFELVDETDAANLITVGVYTVESPETTGVASDPTGHLNITNADFGDPGDNFTVYQLTPPSLLLPDHKYHVYVRTDLKMNAAGNFLEKDWGFSVTTAEACTCQPFITHISPSEGGIGQCITINGACFKGTKFHKADPDQLFFGATPGPIESSENNFIVTTSPDMGGAAVYPKFADLTVRITYQSPSTYGSIMSDPFSEYTYINGDEAQGPCLFKVSTPGDVCYPGTQVTLTGKRFNAGSSTKVVTYNNTLLNALVTTWADTRIKSEVPASAVDIFGQPVNVRNDAGLSNGVPDDICHPLPGVPVVTKFWPTCDTVCVNAAAGATFSEDMNQATMTPDNIKIYTCTNSTCDTFSSSVVAGVIYDIPDKTLIAIPSSDLEINTWYKVTLNDAIKSAIGESIGNMNEGNNFVWTFKTKNSATVCALARVDVTPATRKVRVGQSLNYTAYAYSQPDSCDASGQMLNNQSYNWAWQSSNPLQATVSSNDTFIANGMIDPKQSVEAHLATNNVEIQATAQGQSDHGDLTITDDPAFCEDDSHCKKNELGEDCLVSTCVDNRCTPVLNSFSPADGAVGTWVAAAGCWFGNYVPLKSKLLFFNNQEGIIPDTNICGTGTWNNTRILREVPAGAATGVITVNRDDDRTAVSASDFTVNTVVRPGICAFIPPAGREGKTEVQIKGKNFGGSKGTSHVTFNNNIDADYTPAIWENNNIRVIVPANAQTGDVKVTVAVDSNGWPFRVIPSTCETLCTQDTDCFIVPDQGCDKDGCCGDRPKYTSSPANNASGVCLNTAIRINFNQPMDQGTLNAGNILLASGPPGWVAAGLPGTNIPLTGKIITGSKTATISLGVLLSRNTEYRVSLHPANIKNSRGVSLGTTGTIIFRTADSSGPCEISSLSLTPSNHIFTDNTQTQDYTALALDSKGNPVEKIPGIYDWTWAWSAADSSVASITDLDNEVQIAMPHKNGDTTFKVEANPKTPAVGWTGTKDAQAAVRVIFCDMPWQFEEPSICQPIVEGCTNFNFSLFYCRGKLNQTLLPDFDAKSARGQSGSVLKQFLFKESDPEKKDAIGIRIYANPEGLSPSAWYKKTVENPGSPQSLTVDGYQAVRDGRTVYVGATNIDYAGPQIYNNIYLISYNDEASGETKNIFDQMLSNWHFNINIWDGSDKELIVRDLNRINDLKTIVGYLETYRIGHQEYVSENMAQDPSFENNASIPSSVWETQGTAAEVSIAADEKHDGSRAVKISLGANGTEWAVQDITVELGKTYEVSAWIKTNITGSGAGGLLSECRTPDGNFNTTTCKLNKSTTAVTGASDWVKRSVVVNANLADHKLRIGCKLNIGAASSGQIWCDDFQVREISAPYPSLTAGSYLPNMSTSRWIRSWDASLGNALGKTLPVDPLNNIICDGTPSDTNACWDEPSKKFSCMPGSHIYAYKTDNGMDYQLYANLEYSDLGNWKTGTYLSCSLPSVCQCFNKLISGP